MKKFLVSTLLALASLTAATSAHATNWTWVAGNDDQQLIIDVDTWEIFASKTEYNLVAEFRFVYSDAPQSPIFWYNVTTHSCSRGQGQVNIYQNLGNEGWTKTDTYWFTKNGTTAYEYGARRLCAIWQERLDRILNEEKKAVPQNKSSKKGTSI